MSNYTSDAITTSDIRLPRNDKRRAFTLAEGATHVDTWDNVRKSAFTLAEVLITLAIIGVVAAMTIPTLVQNYKKRHVPIALLKFYTTFNQAIHLSETENGSIKTWSNVDVGFNAESMKDWWDKYMAKYYKTAGYESLNKWLLLQAVDGTAFAMGSCKDFKYATSCISVKFCMNYKTCQDEAVEMGYDYGQPTDGKNSFLFYLTDKGLVTYAVGSNKERTEMIYSTSSGNIHACGSTSSYARNANFRAYRT